MVFFHKDYVKNVVTMLMTESYSFSEVCSPFYFKPQILKQGIDFLLNKKESDGKEE